MQAKWYTMMYVSENKNDIPKMPETHLKIALMMQQTLIPSAGNWGNMKRDFENRR